MKALIFPGQGAQAAGMGEGLFERYPELVETADDVMGLADQLFFGKAADFDEGRVDVGDAAFRVRLRDDGLAVL